jgi:phosphoglycolate phosphatase
MTRPAHLQNPGIIFDLDGTLIDTLLDITNAINAAFTELDLPPRTPFEIRALIGEGLANLLRRASGIEAPEKLNQLVECYRRVYAGQLLQQTRLYPGMADLLDALVELRIPMSVLSNKPHEFTAPICDALLPYWPFVECRGSVDDVPRKPHPAVSLRLAERMHRRPSDILLVGDSTTDLETARNANMVAVAVTWGYRDLDELTHAGPDVIVHHPSELVAFIRSLQPNAVLPPHN